MFAVYVSSSSGSGSSALLIAAVLLLALGFSPLLDWFGSAWKRAEVRRIVGALVLVTTFVLLGPFDWCLIWLWACMP